MTSSEPRFPALLVVLGVSLSLGACSGDDPPAPDASTPDVGSACQSIVAETFGDGGKVSFKGSTHGAHPLFEQGLACGGSQDDAISGPARIHGLQLAAGRHYRVTFSPFYYLARLAIARGACEHEGWDAACKGERGVGASTPLVALGKSHTTIFSPKASDTYHFIVSSAEVAATGRYVVEVEEIELPGHDTCAAPEIIVGDTPNGVRVEGTTMGATHGIASQVHCDEHPQLLGSDVYYLLVLTPEKTYRVDLSSDVNAVAYLFGNHCDASKMSAECASYGSSGHVMASSSAPLYFRASSAAMRLAVGATSAEVMAPFALSVSSVPTVHNDRCQKATAVELVGPETTLMGTTAGATNEFTNAITCGGATALVGPQVYYALRAPKTASYTLSLSAEYDGAKLLVFSSGSCDAKSINADCGSQGASGHVSLPTSGKQPVELEVEASKDTPFYIAVDSRETSGSFALTITEKVP